MSHNARTVNNVAGFMFGNEVLVGDAVNCFNACNDLNRSYVAEKMHEWYYLWQRNSYRAHMSEYYNTRLKCKVWINGWELDQLEKVPGAVVADFGLENSGCPQLIRCAIANVREDGGQKGSVRLSYSLNCKGVLSDRFLDVVQISLKRHLLLILNKTYI
jgi:hypothetical protein